MRRELVRFIRDDEGQDLIEYGLLAGVITTLAITAITAIGTRVTAFFQTLNTRIQAAPAVP